VHAGRNMMYTLSRDVPGHGLLLAETCAVSSGIRSLTAPMVCPMVYRRDVSGPRDFQSATGLGCKDGRYR
jgi:hypothetical protein